MKAKSRKIDITAETTLNELMQYCKRSNTKARKRPGIVQLRKNAHCHCVASFADDKLNYKITVYDNGYASYETFNRETVINLYEAVAPVVSEDLATPADPTAQTEYSTVIDGEYSCDLGKISWKTAITLLGENQIEQNMFKHLSVSRKTKIERNPDIKDETDNVNNANNVDDVDDVNNVERLDNNDVNRQAIFHAHIPDPETAYILRETRRELRSAISKARKSLTKKQEEVYTLRYEDERTLKEIGDTLNISQFSVADRIDGIAKKYHKHVDPVR